MTYNVLRGMLNLT